MKAFNHLLSVYKSIATFNNNVEYVETKHCEVKFRTHEIEQNNWYER